MRAKDHWFYMLVLKYASKRTNIENRDKNS